MPRLLGFIGQPSSWIVVGAFLVAFGCTRGSDEAAPRQEASRQAARAAQVEALAAKTSPEAQMLGIVQRIHRLEIERGELAVRAASRDDVRAYAERVVRDHRHAEDRLRNLAETLGVPIAVASPTGRDREAMHRLVQARDAKDASFDRVYLESTMDTHDRAITRLIEAQAVVSDELARYIGMLVPIMIQHRALGLSLLLEIPTA